MQFFILSSIVSFGKIFTSLFQLTGSLAGPLSITSPSFFRPLRIARLEYSQSRLSLTIFARYVTFQMAEVVVSKRLFEEILERIHQLKPAGITDPSRLVIARACRAVAISTHSKARDCFASLAMTCTSAVNNHNWYQMAVLLVSKSLF